MSQEDATMIFDLEPWGSDTLRQESWGSEDSQTGLNQAVNSSQKKPLSIGKYASRYAFGNSEERGKVRKQLTQQAINAFKANPRSNMVMDAFSQIQSTPTSSISSLNINTPTDNLAALFNQTKNTLNGLNNLENRVKNLEKLHGISSVGGYIKKKKSKTKKRKIKSKTKKRKRKRRKTKRKRKRKRRKSKRKR
jgi:hypothetical protein